jgi:uncharacterized membrane protein (DUF2068 family)
MKNDLKITSLLFVLGEILDILTTGVGILLGLNEINFIVYQIGWVNILLLKIIITLIVFLYIQFRANKKWLEWMFVIVGSIIVPWNIFCILLYSIDKYLP